MTRKIRTRVGTFSDASRAVMTAAVVVVVVRGQARLFRSVGGGPTIA